MKTKFLFVLITVAVLLIIGMLPSDSRQNDASLAVPSQHVVYAAKIDTAVWQELKASPDGTVVVLALMAEQADLTAAAQIDDWEARGWAVYNSLKETADRTQAAALSQLTALQNQGHVSDVQSFWIVNLIAAQVDETGLWTLAAQPGVATILPQIRLEVPELIPGEVVTAPETIEWGIDRINAPDVWSTYNITGTGAVAANVDTGVDYTHPALISQYRGNLGGGVFDHNYNWYDPTGATTVPTDGNGHGTHVMGTEVGDDGGANQIGVAPGAEWMAAFGCCPDNTTLLEAQQFILAPTDLAGNNPNPSLRPDVLNQSWGGPGGSQLFEMIIASIRAAGIFPSFSAGNSGAVGTTGCGRLGSPGDSPSAFNVGATDMSNNIASFSSRGPNPFTGQTGPEVAAPGVNVRSSFPGGIYLSFNGTSMSAPHVAGAAALLIAVEPQLRGEVEQLEELLRKTATPLTSSQTCGGVPGSEIPNNVIGWGLIDVKAAADTIWQAGTISGTVTASGNPVADALITYTRLGHDLTTTTDSNGQYEVLAGAGSWDMTVTAYGYQSASANGVAVVQNNTTIQDFSLTALTDYTLTGSITDALTGQAVEALVKIDDEPLAVPVMANSSGVYTTTLPAGSHSVVVEHPGYDSQTQNVTLSGNQTLDFTLASRINYTCMDNQDGYPLYNWIDATGGTAYPLDDDASSGFITLASPFTYFGNTYNTVRINSNGFIYFGNNTYNTAHMVLPFEGRPNNDLMALGEDLNPALGTQGTIYALPTGDLFVVQYDQVEHWASGFPETFEIILNLVTGEITYQYQTLSWPDFTTVGLENEDGSVGKLYSYANSANLTAGRAVRFAPAVGNAVNWDCTDQVTDLAIAQTDTPDPVATGQAITYTITITNNGPIAAADVTVVDTLPANVTFNSATPSSGSCSENSGVVLCELGSLADQAAAAITIVVTPNQAGTLTNTAELFAAQGDPDISDNVTVETTQVQEDMTYLYLPLILK